MVDVEALVLSLLPDDVDAGTQKPANLPLPFIIVRKVGGASSDARFVDQADVRIDVIASAREEAFGLSDEIRSALWTAWDQQIVTPHGHITWLSEEQAPAQFTDNNALDGTWSFRAVYDLTIRGDGK